MGSQLYQLKIKDLCLKNGQTDVRQLATDEELVRWFSNGNAEGVAITINETEFAIDTDGTGESLFQNKNN